MFKELLEVTQVDDLVFSNLSHRENFRQTIFGGQVLAQALMSACLTVEDRLPHSLHAYFLRPGKSSEPILYAVEKIRDGNSITSRRVVATQSNKPIFHLSASFHSSEPGYEHQVSIPDDIPSPESLEDIAKNTNDIPEHGTKGTEASPFKLLTVPEHLFTSTDQHPPEACFWIKTIEDIPSTPIFQTAALAFASDLGLLATALLPHPTSMFSKNIFAASIDHAIWFHASEFTMSDWMLCKFHSPWAGNARGLTNATLFSRDGTLIASTTQEGLIRPI